MDVDVLMVFASDRGSIPRISTFEPSIDGLFFAIVDFCGTASKRKQALWTCIFHQKVESSLSNGT